MKKIYSTILPIVMILCLAMLSSCSGNSDETENGGTDDGILRITADKTAIQADGVEKVTFTVKLGTKDVSEESTMNLILVKESGEENLDYGVRAFSTSVPGTYVFKARYYEGKAMVSENEVTVQVAPVSGGTSYYHKLLGMQFTSIGCQACPALSTTLKAIQTEQPGRLAIASFHMDFGGMTDPMSTAATNNYRTNILGNFSGLPRFFYNLRKGTKEMISIKSQIEEELQKELSNYPASCGVAVESVYNASDRTVKITGKLTSNVTNTYRCLIYLVEDGIKYFQTNGANDYTHNNVVRAVVSTSLNGDRFNGEVNAGVESTMQRSYQLEPGWNVDNMRVIVSMLTTLDGNTFSTSKAGTYAFEASYGNYVSKLVTVVASAAPGTPSKFVRRICAMEFTGTWCAMCPAGMTRLNYLISSSYEGIVYLMSFHVDGTSADPMTIEQSSILSRKFAISGYPSCVVDMREAMGLSENYSVMRAVFNKSLEEYPASCGVAIQSQYNGQADVTVSVKSEKGAEYRLILYAVENGLKYQQNDGGVYRDYTHNHVVRKLLSATVDGDKLGHIAAGKEKSISYTVIMEEGWNAENLSFYALVTDENGYVNNLAVCKAIDGDADYEYVND